MSPDIPPSSSVIWHLSWIRYFFPIIFVDLILSMPSPPPLKTKYLLNADVITRTNKIQIINSKPCVLFLEFRNYKWFRFKHIISEIKYTEIKF